MGETVSKFAVVIFIPMFGYWLVTLDHRNRHAENQLYAPLGFTIIMGGFGIGLNWLFVSSFFISGFYEDQSFIAIAGLWLIGLGSLVAAVDGDFRKVTWDDDQIIISRIFRPVVQLKWHDITRLERKDIWDAWRLRFEGGDGFGFNDLMRGSNDLATICMSKPHIKIPKQYQHIRDSLLDEEDGK